MPQGTTHKPRRSELTGEYIYRNVYVGKRRHDWTFARYTYVDGHYGIASFHDGMRTLRAAFEYIDTLIDEGHTVDAGGLWTPSAIEFVNAKKAGEQG